MPVSTYGCESIIKEGDTISIDYLLCSDSVRFVQLFSYIEVDGRCIDIHVEGTTWYSVKVGSKGEFENLQVKREVDNCFSSTAAQIEAILSNKKVIEKEYFNTELLFYHKFRIMKNEN
ncbi:MAG: hypothetical protein WDZ35_07075 [Crocinitomicaceae bacterium]